MRHVILGSQTPIGTSIVRILVSLGIEPVIACSPSGKLPPAVDPKRVRTNSVDIIDIYSLTDLLQEDDIVYNAQVIDTVTANYEKSELYNNIGLVNLLGAATAKDAARIVTYIPQQLGWKIPLNAAEETPQNKPSPVHKSLKQSLEILEKYREGEYYGWKSKKVDEFIEQSEKFEEDNIEKEDQGETDTDPQPDTSPSGSKSSGPKLGGPSLEKSKNSGGPKMPSNQSSGPKSSGPKLGGPSLEKSKNSGGPKMPSNQSSGPKINKNEPKGPSLSKSSTEKTENKSSGPTIPKGNSKGKSGPVSSRKDELKAKTPSSQGETDSPSIENEPMAEGDEGKKEEKPLDKKLDIDAEVDIPEPSKEEIKARRIPVYTARIARLFGPFAEKPTARFCRGVRLQRMNIIGNYEKPISWIHPLDAARAMIIMGDKQMDVTPDEYLINGFTASAIEIIEELEKINRSETQIEKRSIPIERIKHFGKQMINKIGFSVNDDFYQHYQYNVSQKFDDSKAREEWGWEEKYGLEKTAKNSMNWFINHHL